MSKKICLALCFTFVASVSLGQFSGGPAVVNQAKVKTYLGAQVGFPNFAESTTTVDISGAPTGGDNPIDDQVVVVDLGTGVDAHVIGIGFEVTLRVTDPSWLSEATVDFDSTLLMTPGVGFDLPGLMSFSSGGIVDLRTISDGMGGFLDYVAPGGITTLTLFEAFDDFAVAPDGFYLDDSIITIQFDEPSPPLCDFDANGDCDLDDLNGLLGEGPIQGGVPVTPGVNDMFDINSDGLLDLADRDLWLATAATENGLGSPYKLGDANLDGTVDGFDFLAWNQHKFIPTLLWDFGDFNGDGIGDGLDFALWNNEKFTSSDGVSAVPEPRVLCPLIFLFAASGRRAMARGRATP